MPKVITFCYHWQRPGLKMCNENKNEACIIVHPSAQLPPSLSLYFLSVLMKTFFCYRVCEVIGHWTLSMTHLFLLTVRSVSLPQNSYTSHCGPCPLKALRHVSLSSSAKVPHCWFSCFPNSTKTHILSVPVSGCSVQQKYPPRPESVACWSPVTHPNAVGISHPNNYAHFLVTHVLRVAREHSIHLGEKKRVFSPLLLFQPSALEWLQQSAKLWEISAKIPLPPALPEQDIKLRPPI